jgi:hypothetical protein
MVRTVVEHPAHFGSLTAIKTQVSVEVTNVRLHVSVNLTRRRRIRRGAVRALIAVDNLAGVGETSGKKNDADKG